MNFDFLSIIRDKRIKNKLVTLVLVIILIIVTKIMYDMLTTKKFVNAEDFIGPKIVRVTTQNVDGIYTTNSTIDIIVEFNEEIVIDLENKPRMLLQLDGGKTRYAEYVESDSRSTMKFEYSILKGDSCSYLNYVAEDSLEARGTIVKDKSGNESSLIMPLATSENSLKGTRKIRISTDEAYPIIYSEELTREIKRYVITFNKKVDGFNIDDITVSNGKLENFNELIPQKSYEVAVEKTGIGEQGIFVNSGVCVDTESKIPNSSSVIIPGEFYYVGGTKDSGIVISDDKFDLKVAFYNQAEINEKVASTMYGNTFVWVPIDYINDQSGVVNNDENKKVLDGRFGSRNYICNDSSLTYRESISSSIIDSVSKYNGFYVGRYEGIRLENGKLGSKASVKNANETTGREERNKKTYDEGILYNYLTASEASGAINNLYGTSSSVVAHLPYGSEYDTLYKWLEESGYNVQTDSGDWGNYYDSGISGHKEENVKLLLETGESDYTKAKNIYDLAGNLWEWSQESASTKIARGGCYSSYSSTPASYKRIMNDDFLEACGARVFLYIK